MCPCVHVCVWGGGQCLVCVQHAVLAGDPVGADAGNYGRWGMRGCPAGWLVARSRRLQAVAVPWGGRQRCPALVTAVRAD